MTMYKTHLEITIFDKITLSALNNWLDMAMLRSRPVVWRIADKEEY